MCPVFNVRKGTAVRSWRAQIRFLSVGMDENRSVERKSKHERRIGRPHYEQCCPHKARKSRRPQGATHTIAKRGEKCTEVDGGIFELLL